MLDFMLDNIEEPLKIIGMEEQQRMSFKNHIHCGMIPEDLYVIANCDPYDCAEFNQDEISRISAALNSFDLCIGIDDDVSVILIPLKELFDEAKAKNLKVFAIGD